MRFPTKVYLGGALMDGQRVIEVTNPAAEEPVATFAAAGLDDVQKALSCAKDAFPGWSRTYIAERQDWMGELRDAVIANEEHLHTCIHFEMGKPWAQTQEDIDSLKNALAFYAEEIARFQDFCLPDRAGTHDHRMVYEPAGVAVAFLAWNFPLLNLAFKIGPAMAAGCPIIIRHSNDTPISTYAVGDWGHFMAPTVLGNVTEAMDVYQKETFGPIVSLIPFESEDGLWERANDCDDGGLTAYVFTRDLAKAERDAAGLRYGGVQINGVKYDIDLPLGGIGQSGIGHDCSYPALHDYLVVKRITRALDRGAA